MVRSQLLVECSKYTTDEERLSHRPDDVMLEDWVFLVGLFGSEKLKVVSERNKINRGKKLTKHSCGPKSFAEVEESTRDPNTGNKTAPDQIWELQHTHKNNEGKQVWSVATNSYPTSGTCGSTTIQRKYASNEFR